MKEILFECLHIVIQGWPAEILMLVIWHTVERRTEKTLKEREQEKEARLELARKAKAIRDQERVRSWARSKLFKTLSQRNIIRDRNVF